MKKISRRSFLTVCGAAAAAAALTACGGSASSASSTAASASAAAANKLETIQSNAIKCFDYMKENNAILNELVFQRAPAELTSAEIASLQEFADKMFNYASSEDCGIAYKVYSLLLENARLRGDKPAIVRYLY